MDYHDHLSVMDFNELICENLLDVDYGSFKEYYELNEARYITFTVYRTTHNSFVFDLLICENFIIYHGEIDEVITTIKKDSRIQSVHDCHVWTISNDMNALSCHVVVDHTLTMKECELLLENIEHDLLHLNIHHMTIQLETPNHKHDESIICSGTHSHSHNHHAHHHAHVH